MNRSERISKYITENVMNESVIEDADYVFEFTEKEKEAMIAIRAASVPIRLMMTMQQSYADIAKEGMAMLNSHKFKG